MAQFHFEICQDALFYFRWCRCCYFPLTPSLFSGWNEVISHLSPYSWANWGIAIGLGFSVVGAAWGIWLTGASLVGAAVKAPRIRSKNLVSVIFCEATAIYGVILAIILLNKVASPKDVSYNFSSNWPWANFYFAGYSVFFSGCSVGFTNIASGISVGIAGSACALGDAQDSSLFVKILIVVSARRCLLLCCSDVA